MKIYIDRCGTLCIERAGKIADQFCSACTPEFITCGDWCPQFGDPVLGPGGDSTITICQGRVLSGEIVDERPRKEGGK